LAAALLLLWRPAQARQFQRITVRIHGPLALLEVDRPLVFGAEAGRPASDEAVVDLDLPEGARLVGAEVQGAAGPWLRLGPAASAGTAEAVYREALRLQKWRSAAVPLDEGVDLRISVAAPGLGEGEQGRAFRLRYRFVAPLACHEGRFVLRVPAGLDPAPAPAEVSVLVDAGQDAPWVESVSIGETVVRGPARRGPARARATVSTRRPWQVAVGFAPAPMVVLGAWARAPRGEGALAVGLCRAPGSPRRASPERLLLFVDRSRSMGPAGASTVRDMARAFVEALPPTVRFNAVLFDRTAKALFPVARAATLEAMAALDEATGPGALGNGTDLLQALRLGAQLSAREEPGPGPTFWLVLTDGALPERDHPGRLVAALGALSPDAVDAAVLVVRPPADDRVAPAARQVLAALPARVGGILREVSTAAAPEAVSAVLAALRGTGDLFDVRLAWPGSPREQGLLGHAIAEGEGLTATLAAPSAAAGQVELRAVLGGAPVRDVLRPARVPAGWAILPGANDAKAWVRIAPGAAALAAFPPETTSAGPKAAVLRGQMDRQVVRNALSLAFLPRARACYLTRPVRGAQDFELRGRLRLELYLERGEVLDAEVKASTLNRPDIENCLREAAYAIEIPRALNSDAPVIAALNLVFQPHTPSKPAQPGPLSEEIDLLLGPRPPASDPLQLLED
jgi:hypothetical protein